MVTEHPACHASRNLTSPHLLHLALRHHTHQPSIISRIIIRHLLRILKFLSQIRALPSSNITIKDKTKKTHLRQPNFQILQLTIFDHESLIVKILDNVIVPLLIDFEDDGFDGGITFDQDS